MFETRSGLVWGQMVKAIVIRTPWQSLRARLMIGDARTIQEPRTILLRERSGGAADELTWFGDGGLSKLC